MAGPPGSREFFVSKHAFERYHLLYPGLGYVELIRDLEAATELDVATARPLMGRPTVREPEGDRYYLSCRRDGIFIVREGAFFPEYRRTVITFIRLGDPQRAFALKHWPEQAVAR